MSGAGRGFTEAVILLSPALPGLTYAHPQFHPDVAAAVQQNDDHTLLPLRDALAKPRDAGTITETRFEAAVTRVTSAR